MWNFVQKNPSEHFGMLKMVISGFFNDSDETYQKYNVHLQSVNLF